MTSFWKKALGNFAEGLLTILWSGIYVMKEEAYQPLTDELHRLGYRVTEHDGYFSAVLREDVLRRVGKCPFCKEYIEGTSVRSFELDCERCGKALYRRYVDNGSIEIFFGNNRDERFWMKLHSYDREKQELTLYVAPEEKQEERSRSQHLRAIKILRKNRRRCKFFSKEGIALVTINCRPWRKKLFLDVSGVLGGFDRWTCVKLYEGKEYSQYEELPVPSGISVIKAWTGYPLEPSPTLHEKILHAGGIIYSSDYYSSDNSEVVKTEHLERMSEFVRKMTTLNVHDWDRMTCFARKSGPSFIYMTAQFCQKSLGGVVLDYHPHEANLFLGVAKLLTGQAVNQRDLEMMVRGAEVSKNPQQLLGYAQKVFGKPAKKK